MGQGYLIDSNVVIGYLDNKLPDDGMRVVSDIIDDLPNISVITQIEVLRYNTSNASYQILRDFIKDSMVYNLNDEIVDQTIVICKSNKIKLPDAIIAATAAVYKFTLITRNVDDFKKITELKLLNPWHLSADQHPQRSL